MSDVSGGRCGECRADFSEFPRDVPFCPFCGVPQYRGDNNEPASEMPQPQGGNEPTSHKCEPQGGNVSVSRMPQPQGGNEPTPRMPQPQGGNEPTSWMPQPQRGNEPDSEMPQPQGGNEPTSRIPQPQRGNEPDFEMPLPQGGNGPDSEMPQPQRGNEPDSEMPQPQRGNEPDSEMPQPQGGNEPDSEMPQPQGGNEPASRMLQPQGSNEPTSQMPQPQGGNEPASRMLQPQGGNEPTSRMPQPQRGNEPVSEMPQPQRGNEPDSEMPQPQGGNEPDSEMPQPQGGNEPASRMPQPQRGNEPTSRMPQPQRRNEPDSEMSQSQICSGKEVVSQMPQLQISDNLNLTSQSQDDGLCQSQGGQQTICKELEDEGVRIISSPPASKKGKVEESRSCAYCSALLLSPTATICNSCGRRQRWALAERSKVVPPDTSIKDEDQCEDLLGNPKSAKICHVSSEPNTQYNLPDSSKETEIKQTTVDSRTSIPEERLSARVHESGDEPSAKRSKTEIHFMSEYETSDDDHTLVPTTGAGSKVPVSDDGGAGKPGGDKSPTSYADAAKGKMPPKVPEMKRLPGKKDDDALFPGTRSSKKMAVGVPGTKPPQFRPPSGLRAAPERSVQVTFHVVLPVVLWEWNDSNSRLHIRFGCSELGNWSDQGEFSVCKMHENGLSERSCKFLIDKDLLQKFIPYKYVVHSPKAQDDKDRYERIQGYYPNPNRCLKVDLTMMKRLRGYKGMIDQYDTIAYPEKTAVSTSLVQKFKNFVRTSVTGSQGQKGSSGAEFKALEGKEMSSVCFQIYLKDIQNTLGSGKFPQDHNIRSLVEKVVHTFLSVFCPTLILPGRGAKPLSTSVQESFKEEVQQWFDVIVTCLQETTLLEPGRKLIIGVFIAQSVWSLNINGRMLFRENFVIKLLKLLTLVPDRRENGCSAYESLCGLLPESDRSEVATSIASLCRCISYRDEFVLDWLMALPLYHFLRGISRPCKQLPLDREVCSAKDVNTLTVRHTVKNCTGFIDDYFVPLEHMMKLDSQLVVVLLSVCPISDLKLLFSRIPCHIAVAWLASMEWHVQVVDLIDHIGILKQVCSDEHVQLCDLKRCCVIMDTSALLLCNLLKKHRSSERDSVKLLAAAASLLLQTVTKYGELFSEEDFYKRSRESVFARISEKLWEWIVDGYVIGGSVFGHTRSSWKGKVELEVWQMLLDSAPAVPEWHDIIKTHVHKRVHAVRSPDLKIELACLMEENIHSLLADIVMDAATEAVNTVMSKPERAIEQLERKESVRVGKLLGRFMKNRYPKLTSDNHSFTVTFDDLLHWKFWPNFIKINGRQSSKLYEGLPEECRVACTVGYSCFLDICVQLKSGVVTLNVVKKIKESEEQMKRLCQAMQGYDGERLSFVQLQLYIKLRRDEFCQFEDCRKSLLHLCNHIRARDIEGLTELCETLKRDYGDTAINTLCVRDGKEFNYLCFQSASTLVEFARDFVVMSKTNVFVKVWNKVLRASPPLTMADVAGVWKSTMDYCQALCDDVLERSIKLSDVDQHFKDYQADLEGQLLSLFNSLNTALGRGQLAAQRIIAIAKHMKEYWNLCRYRDVADVFLRLRHALKLQTGDFQTVEKLSSKVPVSMKDWSLGDVNQSLVNTGRFLDDIVTDEKKRRSLQTFVDCQEVVHWIRETTTDVSALLNFVNVALATAAGGEGDLAQDMLSNLRAVGSGFGALIYCHFPQNAGCTELIQQCRSLWDALADNPNLPDLLADCNRQLAWYKSVKETQGSVEVTSYGQMENILKYGRYRVGCISDKTFETIHDVVSLKLEERDKTLSKTMYSLDELRDLESKLVLITGSNADNRTRVDLFLDTLHSVTRIAEVLMDLQSVGNVKYSDWALTVPCALLQQGAEGHSKLALVPENDLVPWLQKTAREMEQELKIWLTDIANARKKFYELNYYTTLQLVTLRRELGTVKSTPHAAVTNPDVLTLLHSVSSHVTFDLVKEVLIPKQPLEEAADTELPANTDAHRVTVPDECIQPTVSETPVHSADTSMMEVSVKETSLSEDDLNIGQQEILANVMRSLKYGSSKVVLMAFKECGDDADRYAIEDWCVENADNYDFDEVMDTEDVSFSDEHSSYSSDGEQFGVDLPTLYSVGNSTPKKDSVETLEHISPKIQITKRQTIDGNHPTVQDLVSADYTEQESIETVEYCGDDLGACMDYLSSKGEGEKLSPVEEQSSSRERSFKETRPATADVIVHCDEGAESRYLTLEELGTLLKSISALLPAFIPLARVFNTNIMKEGAPNLLVVSPEHVLKAVLVLFLEDESLPLPTPMEVLICSETTTADEVILLWNRALSDPGFRRIFCLVHAERLSYQVSDKALRALAEQSQACEGGYRLVIICSKKDEDKSHIISKLQPCKRPFAPHGRSAKYQQYLRHHFTSVDAVCASAIDTDNSCVRAVTSKQSGMGKSLFIERMERNLLQNLKAVGSARVVIPIHGPTVSPDTVLEALRGYNTPEYDNYIFHFDIAPGILWKVDTILFSLLVLRSLCDSRGRVWRCKLGQLYTVEATVPEKQEDGYLPEQCTLAILELLPSVECVSPRCALELGSNASGQVVMDHEEFASAAYQRVFQYLRRHASGIDLDHFNYLESGRTEGTPAECLDIIVRNCGVRNPSWSEIRHFVHFLDIQLMSCERSVFCDQTLVGDVMSGLKGFVVTFMMRMSRDFATSSLQGEIARENLEEVHQDQDLENYQIRRHWEQSSHPYIFFNQDGVSITFVGFRVSQNGDLFNSSGTQVLQPAIMRPQLYTGLVQNRVNFDENYNAWQKGEMINKIGTVMGLDFVYDPDESYVLTLDNLIKMLAIQMRFRCGIPVIIMGETGCGKTRLIRYMCDLAKQGVEGKNMLILKVHGGISETDVIRFMDQAITVAKENMKRKLSTVVFFDEANTTDAIGLIKEIMCDRRLCGKALPVDMKFIAACNPYRRHSQDMIRKLESAGLGFYVQVSETQQKLGMIPLRQLVYRVLDLPPSMRPLVYDFGQLNERSEADYIKQIVADHIKLHPALSKEDPAIIAAVTGVLDWSQKYMRGRQDECSFVSLRDVERTMIVFEYFFGLMKIFSPLINGIATRAVGDKHIHGTVAHPNDVSRSLLLSLCVCYHARLQDRRQYEKGVTAQFVPPLGIPGNVKRFRNEIKWCQQLLLDNMNLGENIAKNAALRENVFMMAVCIELRIPLFLVGKPGSSKSLAKAIVQGNFHGQASTKELLRNFKQVQMVSYQCSQLSTPDSVIEVFHTAKRYQRKEDTTKYVSVVVLDEVGLAEDSPNLPLKALHPLLEDGTEGADKTRDGRDEVIEREKRVAFIGISNWALDPAKMNRGVMVTRGDPDANELEFSASGICSNKQDDPVRERLQAYFKPLAEAFMAICKKQEREFFGLRDYYSLIKMLYWMCEQSGHPPSQPQMEHAIKRNFGGLETLDPLEEFGRFINIAPEVLQLENFKPEIHHIVNPDCSRLGLIKTSLRTKDTSFHGENRYLLFLTENYAALDILKHYVMDSRQEFSSVERRPEDMEPFILFGSSFPKDKEYTQVCRNINQIKICMETGRTVILLNLENLYESLYDLLNQYYIQVGRSRYVDLGLQTHRVKCRVHENFKLILIAEKNTVYAKFPTPLINRMEKHFVMTSSVLLDWQQEVLDKFQEWTRIFSVTGQFKEGDAFIGYQKDTPAAVVFQATNQLKAQMEQAADWDAPQLGGMLSDVSPEALLEAEEGSKLWKDAVLHISKYLLLQTAPDDALVRLHHTGLPEEEQVALRQLYHNTQSHRSVEDYLRSQLANAGVEGLRMQITTHSHLLSYDELCVISTRIGMKVTSFFLHEFDTELDFCNKISPIFFRGDGISTVDGDMEESVATDSMLIVIQCDSGHLNGDLIACGRYRIDDQSFNKRLSSNRDGQIGASCNTHVLFVIHLPHKVVNSSLVGFQGLPWMCAHIDDLRPDLDITIVPEQAINMTISELFYELPCENDVELDVEAESPMSSLGDTEGDMVEMTVETMEWSVMEHAHKQVPRTSSSMQLASKPHVQYRRLHGCIQAAVSKVQDAITDYDRATQRVALLVGLIPRDSSLGNESFHSIMVEHVFRLLKERDEQFNDRMWVLGEAMSVKNLQNGGTFRNVLARRVDTVVIPIFAGVIARIDLNYNLDLIGVNSQVTAAVSRLWLEMFKDPSVMQFQFKEMITSSATVLGIGSKISHQEFKCQLPFSWLIKEVFDAHWDNAMDSTAADDSDYLVSMKLAELVLQTPVGHILESISEDADELYRYYLHDFVKYVHRCKHVDEKSESQEYQVIRQALFDLAKLKQNHGSESLVHKIAFLHVAYFVNRSQFFWFGQLSCHSPGILVSLEHEVHVADEDGCTMLHLFGLEKVFDWLEPPLRKDDPTQNLISWLNNIRLSQTAIQSILSLGSPSNLCAKLRLKWQHLRAIQMYVEHVLLKHKDLTHFGRRLYLHLKSDPDFLKLVTLNKVKRQLISMENDLKKATKTPGSAQVVHQIKKSCREFFMEVVSTLCFGNYGAPESDLITMLLDSVFSEKKGDYQSQMELVTRDITPYAKAKCDESPVIRSFLLKLLLEHNSEQVKDHISEYFTRSHRALAGQDHDLCLLCIQCFEDSMYKEAPHNQSVNDALECLNEGHAALMEHTEHPQKPSVRYLEGVAQVRFALSVVATALKQAVDRSTLSPLAQELVDAAAVLCTSRSVNTIDLTGGRDTVGPIVYLIKLLVRKYGFPCLRDVSEAFSWILPQELTRPSDEEQVVDPFAIYGRSYSALRESVGNAVFGKQFQNLVESTKDLDINGAVLLLLAFYSKATLCRASTVPSKQLLPEVLETLNTFIMEFMLFTKEMRWMARALVANAQGGTMAQLCVAPSQPLQCRTLAALVVHAAAVFFSKPGNQMLLPFINMLINPAVLVNTYLPTMPEDYLQEARRVLGGKFYACPRGHPYFVGECGKPVQQYTCNICGAGVGGVNHELRTDNTAARMNDTTQTGYVLGDPAARTTVPPPERSLSPAAVCVLRALMHCAFVWSSCNNQTAVDGLLQLVKPRVAPNGLSEFFWRHLERDIDLLGRATGRGMDESAMIVHLVLAQILGGTPPKRASVSTLGARNAREEWETVFNAHYIQPVNGRLNSALARAMDCVANDETQDHDQLFYLVYERVKVSDDNLEPHLWTYRSRITLEHLRQTLQEKSMRAEFPILHAFLQAEPYLRATQYLPDIVHLQHCLYDAFHHRKDRTEAVKRTFGEFVEDLHSENVRNEYRGRFASLQKAWALVSSRLQTHTRLPVSEEYLLPDISEETTLEYLVPTLSGAGVCTAALLDFLVLTHNDFIEKCKAAISKQSLSVWREHKVPVTHIHLCHLLDYEQHLLSLVLSHCHYSLKLGEGQNVRYDHGALEKSLLDRFIHGKPVILTDIPQAVYLKDICTAPTFAAVRKMVYPQEAIPARVQHDIISELHTPDRIRDALDVVEIVIGFVSSGGRAKKSLGEYVNKVLKMKTRRFSQKAKEYCNLGHTLSLWELLSVELAKQLVHKGQEPFDSIQDDFLQDLSGEDRQGLGNSLRSFNLDKLLGSLYEFIETHLKHCPENERKWTLRDTLEAFLDLSGLPQIPKLEEEFPESITLDQTVSAWKYMVLYQDKLKHEG